MRTAGGMDQAKGPELEQADIIVEAAVATEAVVEMVYPAADQDMDH